MVAAVDRANPAPQPDTIEIGSAGLARGSDDAPITLVEFLDYECPFCQKFHAETMPTLVDEYVETGKVRVVLRDNPLPFHENALPAALAARCAGEQGNAAFWRFADAQAAAGAPLDGQRIDEIVRQVGLDGAALSDCVESGRHEDAIKADAAAAAAAGLSGTPMFIVGPSSSDGTIRGRVIRGAYPIETFRSAIDDALAAISES
ncbi:MAG: DsbA family protein [Gemmatimonadota bacterium]